MSGLQPVFVPIVFAGQVFEKAYAGTSILSRQIARDSGRKERRGGLARLAHSGSFGAGVAKAAYLVVEDRGRQARDGGEVHA